MSTARGATRFANQTVEERAPPSAREEASSRLARGLRDQPSVLIDLTHCLTIKGEHYALA
jgi:hypothetical protein